MPESRSYIAGRFVVVALLVMGAAGAAVNFAVRRPAAQRDERQVAAIVEAVFAATERGDYAALDTLYSGDELTIIEGAGIDRGWVAYRDQHLKPELAEFRSFVYRPGDIEVNITGDVAWAIFRYDLRIELEDRTVDNVGRGTAILERRDGRWVVRHMQTASRPRR